MRLKMSRALRVLNANIKAFTQFTALMAAEREHIKEEIKRKRPPSAVSLREARALLKRAKTFRGASDLLWLWQPVLMVTFLETFLQDILSDAARLDPPLMGDALPTADYDEVASARSVVALSELLRTRWARRFVDSGGPRYLIDRLTRLGMKGVETQTPSDLEELWGVRHVIVHRSGLATHDFVDRHPAFGAVVGKPLQLKGDRLKVYREAVVDLAFSCEFFAVKRWPGLLARRRGKDAA